MVNVGSQHFNTNKREINVIVLPQLPSDRRKPEDSIHFTADTFKFHPLMQRFQSLSIPTPTAQSSNEQLSGIHFTAYTFKFHPLMQTRYKHTGERTATCCR